MLGKGSVCRKPRFTRNKPAPVHMGAYNKTLFGEKGFELTWGNLGTAQGSVERLGALRANSKGLGF